MISQTTIDAVRNDIGLDEVALRIVPDLKPHGPTLKAPCPYPTHDEKTPSFTVNAAKGIFKCFGCGRGGNDTVKMVMDLKHLSFPESVRWLCDEFNIIIEETEETPEAKEQHVKRADMVKINRTAADVFLKNLAALKAEESETLHPALDELYNVRKLTQDTIDAFEISYAVKEFKQLTPLLIDKGYYQQAIELGLIKTKVGTTNSYDTFRHRIIFPIHNELGEVIGFGGRKLEEPEADEKEKQSPKYINSQDSQLYKKDRVLYGIYQAIPHIRKMGFACAVEGYFDVTAFYQTGLPNTVAPCGTAWTEGHAKLLKRYTNHVILIGDGDEAGMRANLKSVDVFLKEGFKVEICPLPPKEDPDSFARKFEFIDEEVDSE